MTRCIGQLLQENTVMAHKCVVEHGLLQNGVESLNMLMAYGLWLMGPGPTEDLSVLEKVDQSGAFITNPPHIPRGLNPLLLLRDSGLQEVVCGVSKGPAPKTVSKSLTRQMKTSTRQQHFHCLG